MGAANPILALICVFCGSKKAAIARSVRKSTDPKTVLRMTIRRLLKADDFPCAEEVGMMDAEEVGVYIEEVEVDAEDIGAEVQVVDVITDSFRVMT